MLKVCVGLSRKTSENFNSRGLSINLEAEISARIDDADGVIQQIREVFDLADEALDQQIESARSIDAQASHDTPPPSAATRSNYVQRGGYAAQPSPSSSTNGNGYANGNRRSASEPPREEPATNKQVQYLISIAKRQRRTTAQLETEVQAILQKQVGIYDLSKREAAQAIDVLTKGSEATATSARF